MKNRITIVTLAVLLTAGLPMESFGQSAETEIVNASTAVLNELMSIPGKSLPHAMVSNAEGIVIVPNMLKVGLVAGVRRGKGLAVVRDDRGAWQSPVFLTMTGGSIGWQVGVQATDVILVLNTRKSVSGLMSGKFTIGVDAAAAAGPVGRQAAAATDGKLGAEIYSYSKGRGLFLGASVDGSILQIDGLANQAYYQGTGMLDSDNPNPQLPPSASQLLTTLAAYSSSPTTPAGNLAGAQLVPSTPGTTANPTTSFPTGGAGAGGQVGRFGQQDPNSGTPPGTQQVPQTRTNDPEETRRQLAVAATQLGALLDDAWRAYLSMPKGVFSGTGTPSTASLEQSLKRFERVARDARYQVLLDRSEFQNAIQLLRAYTQQVRTQAVPPEQPASEASRYGTPARQSIR